MNNRKITRERFSESLCNVARTYGFKTIGSMYKALKRSKPTARWCDGPSTYVRSSRLLNELDSYIEYPSSYYEEPSLPRVILLQKY